MFIHLPNVITSRAKIWDSFQFRLFSVLFIPVALLIVGGAWYMGHQRIKGELDLVKSNEVGKVVLGVRRLDGGMQVPLQQLRTLADSDTVRRTIDDGGAGVVKNMEAAFLSSSPTTRRMTRCGGSMESTRTGACEQCGGPSHTGTKGPTAEQGSLFLHQDHAAQAWRNLYVPARSQCRARPGRGPPQTRAAACDPCPGPERPATRHSGRQHCGPAPPGCLYRKCGGEPRSCNAGEPRRLLAQESKSEGRMGLHV